MNHFLGLRINENEGYLNEADSHHTQRVLRLVKGASISVSYGDGGVYLAKIEGLSKKQVNFKIVSLLRKQIEPTLSIAIAPTKSNERFEWFLEKAVELGVQSIHPIICHHSERKVYKIERGQRIIEAAFKQSHKGYMPQLMPICSLKEFADQPLPGEKFVASLNEGPRITMDALPFKQACLLLIGPEGDFSPEEIKLLEAKRYKHLDLGPEVLRTETAAVQAAGIFNYKQQLH